MLKGKTKTGFQFTIEEETLNDMEMLETIVDVDENPLLMPKMLKMLLGPEQKQRLYEHVRGDNGKVKIEDIKAEVIDIFSVNAVKKS